MYLKTIYKAGMLRSILQISLILFIALNPTLVNAQFITTTDNENSSFSGTPDGDLDEKFYINDNPIEFSITTTGTPSEEVKLAINAYDVDGVEDVNVKFNGTYIGKLRGRSGEWIVSMLDVPLNLWVEGKNKVIIYDGGDGINPKIKVDWGQLIVDGGTGDGAQLNNFELDHFNLYEDGIFNINKWRLYTNLDISVSSETYSTQVQLIEFGSLGNEQFENVSYGSVSSTQVETMTLSYKNDNLSKKFTCRALLINNTTQEIVDFAEFKFYHTYLEGPDPFYMELSNSINSPTQNNVVITCTKFKNYNSLPLSHIVLPDGTTTTNTSFSYTATSNDTYTFTIVLTDTESYSFTHTISNIDRTAPVLTLYGNATETFMEEGTYTDAGAKATDNYSGDISSSIVTVNNVDALVPGNYTITYNVTDLAGNKADQIERQVEVLNKPLEVNTTSPTQSTTSVVFNGNLVYLGSTSITGHGFVWSYLPNPTLDVNIDKCALGSISEKSAFQYTTTSLEMGATYHVRSYATNSDGTVYGSDVEFTYNGINYGTVSIENASYTVDEGNSVSINITRTGGTEGSITVDYTTLNGNAIAGTNFTAKSGTLTFANGESSKTISINTISDSNYTGEKRFYFQLDNISNGAINIDQSYITINDLQSQPTYILGSNVVTHGTGDNGFRSLSLGTNGYQGWSSSNTFESTTSGNFDNSDGDEVDNDYYVYFNQGALNIKDLTESGQIQVTASLKGKADSETNNDGYKLWIYVGSTEIAYRYDNDYNADWYTLSGTDSEYIVSSDYIRLRIRGFAEGAFDNDADVSFDELEVQFDDVAAPTIEQITSNTGTYIYNDKIYIAVTLSERVKVSNATLTLNTGNSTEGTASCIAGGETDCLLFEYSVRESDNKDNIIVTGITGITDYQPNALNTSGIPYTLSGVNVDGILPTITLTAQDNLSDWKTSHSIKTDVSNSDSQKYAWSQSESMPGAGWTSFDSGDIQTINTGDGQWYLHVYASRDNGNSKYVYSSSANLDNTSPQLNLSLSTADWVNTSVTITATVDELHPETITNPAGETTTAISTTYEVSSNSTYSFSATDEAGNSATQEITVSNIDTTDPIITISENGSSDSWVDMARTTVSVDDEDSGIDSFEYLWDNSSDTPASGWLSYSGTATFLSDDTNGNRYLHIRATDAAGNSTVTNSLVFKIDNVKPELTLDYTNPSDWTNADIEVTVSASKTSGQLLDRIILPDASEILATSGIASGTFTISENGLYEFSAIDLAGNFTDKEILITKIDKEVPVLQYQLSTSDWTNSVVTLTLSLDDDNSPIYDSDGYFVEYGSSGGLQIKENEGSFTSYSSAITKTISENTSLTYEAKDALGNNIIQTISITNIDTGAPSVTTSSEDYTWRTADFQVELTFTDEEEGVVAVQQYVVSTSTTTPSSYSDYSGAIDFSSEGTFYIHYKGVDGAGNSTNGYFGPYRLDKTAPGDFSLSVSDITSSSITVSGSTSDDVSGMHNTEPYQFAIDGTYDTWENNTTKAHTGLVPNKSYSFKMKARDNAGLTTETAEINKYTLALDPSVELESNQSTQLKFKVTHNSGNETTPYCLYELKEMGAGASGDNVLTQTWTTATSLTFDGLTAGTHYELWVTTRNGENSENTKIKAIADAVTNRPPVANNVTYTLYRGHQLIVSADEGILENDTDPDGNQLTAVLQSGPASTEGTLNLNSNGSFTFTPANGFTGNATFTYKANDGFVDSDNTATVTIDVVIPTWNGTDVYTTAANWNGNEVPVSTDEVIVESGTMSVNSEAQYAKLTITGGSVLVNNGGILTLDECDFSGEVLQAENEGIIIINGNILSDNILKLRIKSGIKINKGIRLPTN